jgi:hypothetical protein
VRDVDWTCKDCGGKWAPGAPACPRCRSTAHAEAEAPEAVTGEAAAAGDAVAEASAVPEDEEALVEPPRLLAPPRLP